MAWIRKYSDIMFNTNKKGSPIRKLAFFVLCEKSFMPRIAPAAPPSNAVRKSLDSGILQPWLSASLLSRQNRKKEYKLTKIKQIIMITNGLPLFKIITS
jgi:hypothetical protein